MPLFDHLFVLIFALIYPIGGYIGFRRLLRKIEAGMPVNRHHLYVQTILWQWALFVTGLIVWSYSERPWEALGFNFAPNLRFVIGVALTIAGIAFLFKQVRQLGSGPREDVERFKREVGKMQFMMPRNGSELASFNMLSLTAGIVEETLWRGFLFWYLGQVMPLWVAAIISAVAFGLGHSYQGLANVPRVAVVGVVLAALYLLTGSLLLPMVLHAAMDLLQGRMAYDVFRTSD